mgnify:CR=1 FL=1
MCIKEFSVKIIDLLKSLWFMCYALWITFDSTVKESTNFDQKIKI